MPARLVRRYQVLQAARANPVHPWVRSLRHSRLHVAGVAGAEPLVASGHTASGGSCAAAWSRFRKAPAMPRHGPAARTAGGSTASRPGRDTQC